MAKILGNFHMALVIGVILLIAAMAGLHSDAMDANYWVQFLRYLHVFSGILWIGLLYYFNFVQIPTMPKVPAELKPGVTKYIAPAALFWFRYSALLTVILGLLIIELRIPGDAGRALGLAEGYRVIGVGMCSLPTDASARGGAHFGGGGARMGGAAHFAGGGGGAHFSGGVAHFGGPRVAANVGGTPCPLGATVVCALGTLAPGASASASVTLSSSEQTLALTFNAASTDADLNSADNSASTGAVVGRPDLTVALSQSANPVAYNANDTYTADVTNNGTATATSAHVSFTRPSGTASQSASAPGTGPAASCSDRNSRSRMFARSMMYPMKTNSGIEISTSFVITE